MAKLRSRVLGAEFVRRELGVIASETSVTPPVLGVGGVTHGFPWRDTWAHARSIACVAVQRFPGVEPIGDDRRADLLVRLVLYPAFKSLVSPQRNKNARS